MPKIKNKKSTKSRITRKNPIDLALLKSLDIETPLCIPDDPIYAFKFGMVVGLKKAKQLMQTLSGRAKYFKVYVFTLEQSKLKDFVILKETGVSPDMKKIENLLPSNAFNIGVLFALNYSYGYSSKTLDLYIKHNWSDSFSNYMV